MLAGYPHHLLFHLCFLAETNKLLVWIKYMCVCVCDFIIGLKMCKNIKIYLCSIHIMFEICMYNKLITLVV